ncbi:MAG: YncE family protein [Candidatus Limnocylindria bacterium]
MLHLPLRCRLAGALLVLALGAAGPAGAQPSFVAFESGPVRPLALSPDGTRLFAVNTPDNRLEVFSVAGGVLTHLDSIPVGMEPVAVAARSNTQVWVVNHLSDSVSIVDLASTPARVARTLLVGDEPRDIVFAGTGGSRAFISTAHRGQHRTDASIAMASNSGDPELTTPGIGRADVWVFDAINPAANNTFGGLPIAILTLPSDTPRALATSPSGNMVYLAAFHSGNQTTAVTETVVCNGFQVSGGSGCGPGAPGGVVGPANNAFGAQAPEVGIIVKFNGTSWRDSINRNWSGAVPFSLPDHDVFEIDANDLTWTRTFDHVGTILFNMVVNPVNQKIYVTNTELPNHLRFEGAGEHGGSTVQGHLSESRITVIDPSTDPVPPVVVNPQHLNQHIDYGKLHTDVPDLVDPTQIGHSLATPLQPVVSSDGSTLYVAAFGSARIGVFSTAEIESPSFETSFDPTVESASYIATGGGPAGLVLDEANTRLYVLTRFDNSVQVIDPVSKATLATHALHNPEPASIVNGRPFLYDAALTSGNGEASCSSCHVFGDLDSLAWDLGDPDGAVTTNTQPSSTFLPPATTFHPMKGPMTTQTLRGLATEGAMHWRGDRVDGFFGLDPCTEPTGAPCNEDLSFRNFIVAFEGLVGKDGTITPAQMQQFTDFVLQITLPPNPVRALDNSLNAVQNLGSGFYFGATSDFIATCNGCHTTDPAQGFFGSGGEQSFEGEPQQAKVPHLRNVYSKVGMFSVAGEQVRGFGFLHDGSIDTVNTFVGAPVFTLTPEQRTQVEQFVLAFPSDLAPIVGQQVTLRSNNGAGVNPRIDLLIARASATYPSLRFGATAKECDLIVKGSVGGVERGWVREASGLFRDDSNATLGDAALRALAVSQGPLTYTCAPPGSGTRMGIDRDSDTRLDGLDNCAATANAGQENFDGDPLGDACDGDDDGDGLLDVVETNTGILVSASNTGSDPLDTDSDDDGIPDGLEIGNGSDPNDPLSPGPTPLPLLPLAGQALLGGALLFAGARALRRRRSPPSA